MKNQKIIIISFVVLAVGILAYYIYYKSKKSNPQPKPEPINNNDTNKTIVSNGNKINQNLIFPIKKGDAGEHVKRLQIALNYINNDVKRGKLAKLDEDGKFGTDTENRLVLMYGNKTVNQTLAQKIAKDSGLPGISANWISNIK